MPSALARQPLDIRALLTRYSDLLLAATVVGVVAMMIVPLPTFLLDILITANISVAVVLLLVGIYVSEAIRVAAFPSILLITTLFRLGLNVSSTRLILLQADAGEVIQSFGNFVVAGNLVVGAVIFLILTLIQFVVIAKGSERVAEVAARFTLDAMPGKQMAIDADLRSGLINMEEARKLRSTLGRESQLYGAMDGAMKFVKGDAIAGILITVINIVAGLTIGVVQRDMAVGEAANLYALLTIGDGLVSQIPALLISTAAGIVVTRVASEDEAGHLGRDIGQQILNQYRAILVAAGLLFALAIVPGLPTVPFLLLALVTGGIAWGIRRQQHYRERSGSAGAGAAPTMRDIETQASPLVIEFGAALGAFINGRQATVVRERMNAIRETAYRRLGVPVPVVLVRQKTQGLQPQQYRILLNNVSIATGSIDVGSVFVTCNRQTLATVLGTQAEVTPKVSVAGVKTAAYKIPNAFQKLFESRGIGVIDHAEQVAFHLESVLFNHAGELLGIQETQLLLDKLEQDYPALVSEVVSKRLSVPAIADVLRRLVTEQVSVCDLRGILEALAKWAETEKDTQVLAEHVRVAMKRYISDKFASNEAAIFAFLFEPMIEQTIRDSIVHKGSHKTFAMEPELERDILQAVKRQVDAAAQPSAVIVTQSDIRPFVRRLIEADLPDLSVVSYEEIVPTIQIEPVGRITV